MERKQLDALLLLSGLEYTQAYQIANNYWPDCEAYSDLRRKYPWWLVLTDLGPVMIGWRKRVISISWEDTPVRVIVTDKDVTKSETMVHAWNYGDAVSNLTTLKRAFDKHKDSINEAAA